MKAGRLLLLVSATLLASGDALAYEDTGYDPADRDNDYPDVRNTTRRVWTHNGHGYLRITFNADEYLDFPAAYWSMHVKLDTRGDESFDVVMRFWDLDMSGSGCIARKRGGQGDRIDGSLHFRSHGAACRIRTDRFRLTKQVRWRLISPALHGGDLEFAPNTGYYP